MITPSASAAPAARNMYIFKTTAPMITPSASAAPAARNMDILKTTLACRKVRYNHEEVRPQASASARHQ